jgi:hypothetical protein
VRRKLLIATATVAALVAWLVPPQVSGAAGQHAASRQSNASPNAVTVTNFHTFTTSADGGTTVRVSTNGNVYSFESPTGFEHINAGNDLEGYVLCYTPSGGSPVNAYDMTDLSSGFGAATHSSGAPWTVTRNTSDGKLKLTQVFAFNSTGKTMTVTMTVKNLTQATVSGITLRRQVDFDVDTGGVNGWAGYFNWFAATKDSASAWNDPATATGDAHGMVLRHLKGGTHTPQYTNAIGDTSCDVSGGGGTTPTQGDYGATISYAVGNLSAAASKVMSVQYVRD